MAAILTITVTADRVLPGVTIYVIGYLQDPETPPYVGGGIPIDLHVNQNPTPTGSMVTANNGSYFFSFLVNLPAGTYTVNTVAHSPIGDVVSDPATITVGDIYKPQSNSSLDVPMTIEDWLNFVPGTQASRSLVWNPTTKIITNLKPPYITNTYFLFGMGRSPQNNFLRFHVGMGIHPGGVGWSFSQIRLDDQRIIVQVDENIIRFDETQNAIYSDTARDFFWAEVFKGVDVNNRNLWSCRLESKTPQFKLNFDAVARGPPLWLARGDIFHRPMGADCCNIANAMNMLQVVVSTCDWTGTLTLPDGSTINFNGVVGIDHEAHWRATIPHQRRFQSFTGVQSYLGIFAHQPELDLVIWKSVDPENGLLMSRSGRLTFPLQGFSFPFDDWQLTSLPTNSLYSDEYLLTGVFEGGTVDVRGKVLYREGNYASETHAQSYANPFIHWTGIIKANGQTLNVDAYGWGEETKIATSSLSEWWNSLPGWKKALVIGGSAASIGAVILVAKTKQG